MNTLINTFKALNHRTLIVLALVGLLLVPTIAIAITLDLLVADGEAANTIADQDTKKPTPTPPPGYEDFAWGG